MNAPMTPDRLAEILARAEAALPGPWCTDAWEIYQGTEYEVGAEWIGETARGVGGAADMEQDRATAAFVAAARKDVPDLVAEVHRLRTQVAGLERSAVLAEEDYRRVVRGACQVESQLRARVAELETAQTAALAPHVLYPDSAHCRADGDPWPCPTVTALVPAAAPVEDPHDSPLHHTYETGRDLPSMTADEAATGDAQQLARLEDARQTLQQHRQGGAQ
ncbi:hypothetical protein ACFC5Z_23765 [Streptomyces sp. NPDC056004]|uniref:hypothetical protein n=1 Tax=Streptomyces sp. NPDC056004 TaxID=3345677 RepID=UPI0035DFF3FD